MRLLAIIVGVVGVHCSDGAVIESVPERSLGTRSPMSAECDPTDSTRCLLPWPSNTFTMPDPSTSTGLRLRVATSRVGEGDRSDALSHADGFSRLTPLVTAFPADLDPASLGDGVTGAMRLLVLRSGAELGRHVPLRLELRAPEDPRTPEVGIIGYPRVPLSAATDHLAVVTDDLRDRGGRRLETDRRTLVAMARVAPRDRAEAELRAWHAPHRIALAAARIDPSRVLRVWEFTTGSSERTRGVLQTLRAASLAALASGAARVRIDTLTPRDGGSALLVVRGFIEGLPAYLSPTFNLVRGPDGGPIPVAGRSFRAPFRVLIPRGTGDYRVVMFGHGTGGDVSDPAFDATFANAGAAKIGVQFDGLSSDDVIQTFLGFQRMLDGVERCASLLAQSVAGVYAVVHSLAGVTVDGRPLPEASSLRALLSSATLLGSPNPAAGRRPDMSRLGWAGGSLGGTMGLTLVRSEPLFAGGVLNVPGAAWTHFLTHSSLYEGVRPSLQRIYGSDLDIEINVAISQTLWDVVDGGVWADLPGVSSPFLVQESIGDPVLPNVGTAFLSSALGVVSVGRMIRPVPGIEASEVAVDRSALTQFRVRSAVTDPIGIHGFAASDDPSGVAAREQIEQFFRSLWQGSSRVTVPPTCARNGSSCDFAQAP